MNRRLIIYSLIYSLLVIATICISFYGGYIKLLNVVYFLTLVCMFPFVLAYLWQLRNNEGGGFIGGRVAVKEGLKFVMLSTVILCSFQAAFYTKDFKDYKVNHIRSIGPDVIKQEITKGQLKAKVEDIPKIIENDVKQVTMFAEVTAVLFKNIFYGAFCCFISAMIVKRRG